MSKMSHLIRILISILSSMCTATVATVAQERWRSQWRLLPMAESQQELLREAWLGGRSGTLSALSEAKAWALREIWYAEEKPDYGLATIVAQRVEKVGGGHPGDSAIVKFFKRIDDDAEWFPGKSSQARFGPKPALTGQAKNAIAQAAMALKKRKIEPTFGRIVTACPQAVVNPATQKPVDKKRVYDVFRELCYDEDTDHPWGHRARFTKTALTDSQREKRFACGNALQEIRHTPRWYFEKVVYTDICNSVLPRTETKAEEQALARKGGKGWVSEGSQLASESLRGRRETLKQNSTDTERIYWAPFLACGKLHVELLPETFPGDAPAGAEAFVHKLRSAINIRFQGGGFQAPQIVWTDRGPCFFHGNGHITPQFRNALAENGLKHFWGEDASVQPGQLQEVHPHETAVSWLRYQLMISVPRHAWKETREQYGARLKACAAKINASYDVDGLCRALPRRIQALVDNEGDRICT